MFYVITLMDLVFSYSCMVCFRVSAELMLVMAECFVNTGKTMFAKLIMIGLYLWKFR